MSNLNTKSAELAPYRPDDGLGGIATSREFQPQPFGMPQLGGQDPALARYRPDIDGLRAIAILAVVFYHAFPTILTGGFIGVDVFFVISGFLISENIFSSLDRGQFSFLAFYGRRIRRIFPALFLVLLFCLAYGFIVLLPTELAQLGKDTAGGSSFISNLLLWNEAGYFDRSAVSKPLLHLWSLGVEEQFYIFWPVALWIAYQTITGRFAFVFTVAIFSFGVNVAASSNNITADFYSPLTRFWELSSGAMLAWLALHPSSRLDSILHRINAQNPYLRNMASVVGLILIIGGTLLLKQQMRFPGWLALLPTSGAIVLIATGPSAWINRVVLSNRIAVFTGLISYPLYLWHWPLISYAYILRLGRAPREATAIGIVVISFLLAWLTYRLVERPFRFGGNRRSKTIALVAIMSLMGVAGTTTWLAKGFTSRFSDLPSINISKINAANRDGIFQPTKSMHVREIHKTDIAEITSGQSAVLFTGDSVLYQFGPRVQELFNHGLLKKTVDFVVSASCAPIPGIIRTGIFSHCSEMPKISDELIAEKHFDTIVLGGFWQGYLCECVYVERAGIRMKINTPEAVNNFYSNLEDEVRRFVATNHKVYLVLSVPMNQRFDPEQMISRSIAGFKIDPDVLRGIPVSDLVAATADANRRLIDIAKRTGARTLNPLPDICGTGPTCSSFFADGEPKFADEKHLRPIFVKDNITFLDDILTH
jgi:peptidoglycan/LPS O-acetylase OafA/YrhL